MALKRELMTIIENNEEPFSKRIRIANNAFKSEDVCVRHKEALLIMWLARTDSEASNIWMYLNDWLKSCQFRELSRNDIDNDEIQCILDLISNSFSRSMDNTNEKIMLDTLTFLLENKTFQQYFKYNLPIYFQMIALILDGIQSKTNFTDFLNRNIFPKLILSQDNFVKQFLDTALLTLVKSVNKFNDNSVFHIASRIIQKCIFYNNHKSFGVFIEQFFNEQKIEKQPIPRTLFKFLLEIYKADAFTVRTCFKLLFHAFSTAYDEDFQLTFKFFVTLTHIIGFELREKLLLHRASKLEMPNNNISVVKTEMIMCELLQVLCEIKIDTTCEVNTVNLTKFLVNILSEILYHNKPSETSYMIFIKAVMIDPLIAQNLIEQIIIYTMISDNSKRKDIYEELIIAITEIYFKLHRIENLLGKIVYTLNFYFNEKKIEITERYEFRGVRDEEMDSVSKNCFNVDDVLTENILKCFSKSIESLASWQIINVFKSLIFSLSKLLDDIDTIHDNIEYCNYMEILNVLITTFLLSIRVAEHTVTKNTVDKTVKCLEDLRNLLQKFAKSLLTKEHHRKLMRSFLNLSYYWAEMYMMLAYYSTINVSLHTYLSVKEWCLISERIMNFGEEPCKKLLQKLYIQKLRALFLFEENINDDNVNSMLGNIMSLHIENKWESILTDKFIVKNLLQKLDSSTIIPLSEYLIANMTDFQHYHHIWHSTFLLKAVNYVVMMKINRLFSNYKRKRNENPSYKYLNAKVYSTFTEDIFLYDGDYSTALNQSKELYNSNNLQHGYFELKIDEGKMVALLNILKKFPIIFSTGTTQQFVMLYLVALHKDLNLEFTKGNFLNLKENIEDLIIGILQQCKFKITDIFNLQVFYIQLLESFSKWEQIFSLSSENVFRCEHSIKQFEPVVTYLVEKLLEPSYMQSSIIVINLVNKLKKMKMAKEIKLIAEQYKRLICDRILKLVVENQPQDCLLLGFVNALKFYITQTDNKKLSKLQNHLHIYIDFALENNVHNIGCLQLFTSILQNKTKVEVEDNLTSRIWKICKENTNIFDQLQDYSKLIILLIEHVSQEEMSEIIADMLLISDNSVNSNDYIQLDNILKIWKSVISCNLNPAKMKILQDGLEELLRKLIILLDNDSFDKDLFEKIFSLEKSIIQTNHLQLPSAMVDMFLLSVTTLLTKHHEDFHAIYTLSISMLSSLLKYHKTLIMDRLPPFLQEYRILLKGLCARGNSDLNLDEVGIQQVADCAHHLEKLTRNIVACQKDMARIAAYLIADILEQYEKITLYPNVKIHLNNCIYSLISICDQHAIAFLMRVLSSASTEIFKIMYENYKKYYRFTGKV